MVGSTNGILYLAIFICVYLSSGITFQSEMFPLRFLVELLNKQCRIILTGNVDNTMV